MAVRAAKGLNEIRRKPDTLVAVRAFPRVRTHRLQHWLRLHQSLLFLQSHIVGDLGGVWQGSIPLGFNCRPIVFHIARCGHHSSRHSR
jgi:hypothetical protein